MTNELIVQSCHFTKQFSKDVLGVADFNTQFIRFYRMKQFVLNFFNHILHGKFYFEGTMRKEGNLLKILLNMPERKFSTHSLGLYETEHNSCSSLVLMRLRGEHTRKENLSMTLRQFSFDSSGMCMKCHTRCENKKKH